MTATREIRVLIIDDAVAARRLIAQAIATDPALSVVWARRRTGGSAWR